MEKGDFVEIYIEDMSQEGNGIGHADDGMTIFASGAAYGDRVRVGISNVKKNYATGKTVNIIEKSPFRKNDEDVCPYIEKCGGCGYGKLVYEKQLELKEKSVKDKLERLGGVDFTKVKLNHIIPSPKQMHYRDKATIAVFNDMVGFKSPKSNFVVDCEECFIQNERANQAANALREYIREEKLQGTFEKMVVRTTMNDENMVCLYTRPYIEKQNAAKAKNTKGKTYKKFDINSIDLEKLAYGIDDAVENTLESIWIDDKIIAGKNTVLDRLGDLDFEISPLSFYQVNPEQMKNLYDKAFEYAGLKGNETVLDLYCGIGTIGLYFIEKMNRLADENGLEHGMIYGIESVKPAIIDANRNAVINHIVNARYFCGKAEDELPFMMGMKKLYKPNEVNEMVERVPEVTIDKVNVAVVDPPRAGCEKDLLDAVIKAEPESVVYISCDPGTLARDVKYLGENGYELKEVTPCDMFPETPHVETIVLLQRENS